MNIDRNKILNEIQTETFWRHNKTGEVYILARILFVDLSVVLQRTDGGRFTLPAQTLAALYSEIDDDDARAILSITRPINSGIPADCVIAGDLFSRTDFGDLEVPVRRFKTLGGQRKGRK